MEMIHPGTQWRTLLRDPQDLSGAGVGVDGQRDQPPTEMSHGTPGSFHESALFDRFIDVMRNSSRMIASFDTSPTGSTLRLLRLPDLLEDWIDRLMHKRRTSIRSSRRPRSVTTNRAA